jgi:hypothetical protein
MAINRVKNVCPEGTSSEKLLLKNKYLGLDKPCNQLIYENHTQLSRKMRNTLGAVCCEEFVKASYFRCDKKVLKALQLYQK